MEQDLLGDLPWGSHLPAGLCIPAAIYSHTHVWHHEGDIVWQVVGNMALQNRREAIAMLQCIHAWKAAVSRETNQWVLHILNYFWQMYILQRAAEGSLLERQISSMSLCCGTLFSIRLSVWLGGTIFHLLRCFMNNQKAVFRGIFPHFYPVL